MTERWSIDASQNRVSIHAKTEGLPCVEEIARQVHIKRLRTRKNPKRGQQWVNTLAEYAFPKIGRLPVSEVGQPEVLQVPLLIWTEKHETAKQIKAVLDVANSKDVRDGVNPATAIRDAHVLPQVKQKVQHYKATHWKDVPAFYAELDDQGRNGTDVYLPDR